MSRLRPEREAEIRAADSKARVAVDQLRASAAEIHRMWLLDEIVALRGELANYSAELAEVQRERDELARQAEMAAEVNRELDEVRVNGFGRPSGLSDADLRRVIAAERATVAELRAALVEAEARIRAIQADALEAAATLIDLRQLYPLKPRAGCTDADAIRALIPPKPKEPR